MGVSFLEVADRSNIVLYSNVQLVASSIFKTIPLWKSCIFRLSKVHFLTVVSHTSGMPRFFGSFVFNRKRNVVELELKEDLTGRGSMKYSVRVLRKLEK